MSTSRRPAIVEPGAGRIPVRVLAGGMLSLAAAMGIGRFAYTPLLPAMERAAGLDAGGAGLLASMNYAGYLAGALVLTVAAPGAARTLVFRGSLLAVALSSALMACTTSVAVWGVLRVVSGVASAAVFILTSDTVLSALRLGNTRALSGWLYGGVGLGIAVSGITARLVTGPSGWWRSWVALGGLAGAMGAAAWRWVPSRAEPGRATVPTGEEATAVSRPAVALLLAAYTLAGAGYIVTGTFLVDIVDRTPGLGGVGADVWIVVGVAGMLCTVLWGVAGARIGEVRALCLTYLLQACGILLPVLGGGVLAAVGAAVLFGGTFMGISTLTLTIARGLAPRHSRSVIGLLTLGFGLGQIVAPPIAGRIAGPAHDFRPALVAAFCIVLLAAMLTVALGARDRAAESRPRGSAADGDRRRAGHLDGDRPARRAHAGVGAHQGGEAPDGDGGRTG